MTNNRWRLDGATALVTGGTRGIGRAIVEELSDFGARVFVAARNPETLKDRLAEWRAAGRDVNGVAADVGTEEGRTRTMSGLLEAYGGLDVLVNNAGTNIRGPSASYATETTRTLLELNLLSPFEMSRLAYPMLKASERASITSIVSVAGMTSVGTGTPYGMSKAGLIQMTRNLAAEWGADGIRVNAVAPWFIRTDLTSGVLGNTAFIDEVIHRTPARRIGEPDEVAGIVAFLSLPAASYISGQCVAVDGGFTEYGFSPPA